MEFLVIVAAGIVILPVILLFSVFGAYARIRDLEDMAAQMRQTIDTLVHQQWNRSGGVPAEAQQEQARRVRPAGG